MARKIVVVDGDGARTEYVGFDEKFSPAPSWVALVQDEDVCTAYALDAPLCESVANLRRYLDRMYPQRIIGIYRHATQAVLDQQTGGKPPVT